MIFSTKRTAEQLVDPDGAGVGSAARRLLLGAAAGGILLLGACSSGTTSTSTSPTPTTTTPGSGGSGANTTVKIETTPEALAAQITKSMKEKGVEVTSVTCSSYPTTSEPKVTCNVTASNTGALTSEVVLEGDTVGINNNVYFTSDLAAAIPSNVSGVTNVKCPPAVNLSGNNGTVSCTATDASGAAVTISIPVEGGKANLATATTTPG